jgi:serine/threonine protein kinase
MDYLQEPAGDPTRPSRPWRHTHRDGATNKVPCYCPYPSKDKSRAIPHTKSLPSISPTQKNSIVPLFSQSTPHVPQVLDQCIDEINNTIADDTTHCPTLNDLQFMQIIGTGMYSKVYLVQHIATKEYYALKVIPKQNEARTKWKIRMRSEMEVMRSLSHPFIVKMVHNFEDEDNVYVLMEYAAGGELFFHLRNRGRFDEATARYYAAEVVMAIEHLHSHGIIFRDLKLENLVLSPTGHIKLTDFGFAKCLEDSRAYTLCGTPEYLAPEIIRGTGYAWGVDWWALGVLIFEMLAGFSPFYSDSPLEIYKNILSGRIPFPATITGAAKDLLTGLLTRDPCKRLGTVRAGISDVRCHPWFAGIEWTTNKDPPPIVPLLSHKGDTSYFQIDSSDEDSDGENACDQWFDGF